MNGNDKNIIDFDDNNAKESFEFELKFTSKTNAKVRQYIEIAVPWKYLSHFWISLEMSLNYCVINLILTWSASCIISTSTGAATYEITNTISCVPIVTLFTQYNSYLLQQLKSGLELTINWNKYFRSVSWSKPSRSNYNFLLFWWRYGKNMSKKIVFPF